MILYYSPGACSLAPHIALQESGLKYSLEPVNLTSGHFKGGEFEHVNPKGYVPVLKLEGSEVLTEAGVILQYIADQVPERNLIPRPGTMTRYRCQEWLNYIATEIHKGFSPLWRDDTPESVIALTQKDLARKFTFLSGRLEGKAFLMGEEYSVADSYLFTILNWTKILEIDLTPWPNLMGYMERVSSRPATQEALKGEGLRK